MTPLTEQDVRASFVNCSKGEARRLPVPRDLGDLPWADLDFLGWRDPAAPQRAYLVTGAPPVGVVLRVAPQTGLARRSMCSFCLTTHGGDGVALVSARRAGPAGRQGNSVGAYACSDLACSRHLRDVDARRGMHETLALPERVERTLSNVDAFVRQVTAG